MKLCRYIPIDTYMQDGYSAFASLIHQGTFLFVLKIIYVRNIWSEHKQPCFVGSTAFSAIVHRKQDVFFVVKNDMLRAENDKSTLLEKREKSVAKNWYYYLTVWHTVHTSTWVNTKLDSLSWAQKLTISFWFQITNSFKRGNILLSPKMCITNVL